MGYKSRLTPNDVSLLQQPETLYGDFDAFALFIGYLRLYSANYSVPLRLLI
jgi:hypothetical protein